MNRDRGGSNSLFPLRTIVRVKNDSDGLPVWWMGECGHWHYEHVRKKRTRLRLVGFKVPEKFRCKDCYAEDAARRPSAAAGLPGKDSAS